MSWLPAVVLIVFPATVGIVTCVLIGADAYGHTIVPCDCPKNELHQLSAMLAVIGVLFFSAQIWATMINRRDARVSRFIKAVDSTRFFAALFATALIGIMVVQQAWCSMCLIVHICIALLLVEWLHRQLRRLRVMIAVAGVLVTVLYIAIAQTPVVRFALQARLSMWSLTFVSFRGTVNYRGLPPGSAVRVASLPLTATLIFWPEGCPECQQGSVVSATRRVSQPVFVLALQHDPQMAHAVRQLAEFRIVKQSVFKQFLVPLRGYPIVYEVSNGRVQQARPAILY